MTERIPPLPTRASLTLDDDELFRQCDMDTFRASGPGGQKRNKTDSAVRLRHRPTGLAATAVESRSQHENRRKALNRLRETIALEVRHAIDADAYQPGDVLSTCISAGKRLAVGRRDVRYPIALGEILDVLTASDTRVAEAAARLRVSTANLVSFLKNDLKAWARVNQMRAERGLKPLR